MSGWKRIVLIVLGIIIVAGGGAYYWLIMESHFPSDASYTLDMDEVRRLAAEMPGDKPIKIEAEHIGTFLFPATAVVAGDGWSSTQLPVFSYRLVYANGTTGIIDTALSREMGGTRLTAFDPDAYARMETAIGKAHFIVVTHEHVDHIGGLAAYPDLAKIAGAVDLTKEQIDHPERSVPASFSQDMLGLFTPVVYDKYKAIAPGVVLIKAPGHTPGSQMVYVRKADGSEVLFLGDVAWHYRNIDTLRERARLVTRFFLKENRTQVFGELRALSELHAASPMLSMVPGHDGVNMEKLEAAGTISKGFD